MYKCILKRNTLMSYDFYHSLTVQTKQNLMYMYFGNLTNVPHRTRSFVCKYFSGATLEMVIVVGMLKTSGIIFVAFQERFQSSSSVTSLISSVQNAVWSVTGKLRYKRINNKA